VQASAAWFALSPSQSFPGLNQLVVNENAAGNAKPTAKRNLNNLACSVSTPDFAPQPTAKCKSFVLVLRLTINDEPLARKPSVLHANLVTFVFDVPDFHNDKGRMQPNDPKLSHTDGQVASQAR
jgi:hypothetical protein